MCDLRKLFVLILIYCLLFFCLTNSVMAAGGDLDPTFGNGGKVTNDFFGFDDVLVAAGIQPDGQIVVVGIIQVELNLYRPTIARYKTDGSLDPTFGSNGRVFFSDVGLPTVALQPDGKIIVAGTIQKDFGLLRFNSDGSPDTTFGNSGVTTVDFFSDPQKVDTVLSLALQPDGKIVAAGYADSGDWLAVARLNANGSLDTTFGNGGKVTPGMGPGFEQASAVEIQSDSKIVVAGRVDRSANFGIQDFGLARFKPNGQLDDTFGNGGRVITAIGSGQSTLGVRDLVIQGDGKILVAGFANFKFALARYNSDGSLDPGFGSGSGKVLGPDGAAAAVVIQCDGKIVAADSSTFTDSDFRLVRFNTDGALDNSFGNQGIVSTDFGGSDHATALMLQSDCKLVAAGINRRFGHYDDFALARYLTAPSSSPVLQIDSSSTRAVALDSVTLLRDPFSVTTEHNFSADHQTRIILFATNLTLSSGDFSSVSVQAEAAGGAIYTLPVEHVGEVPGFQWLTQVVVKLPTGLANAGSVQVSISLNGNISNKGSVLIQ